MPNIYDLHDKAFSRVSAFVIAKGGERVATVAIKFPADGAGRLYAYVHLIGEEMQRGFASGGGYDKRSAAVSVAILRLPVSKDPHDAGVRYNENRELLYSAATAMDSQDWQDAVRSAGFDVWRAI